jgi:hypothetical protein
VILLICILGLIAGSLAMAPGAVTITLCCVAGACGGGWILYGFISRALPVRLTWLLASTVLIGYCGFTLFNEIFSVLAGQGVLTDIDVATDWVAYALMLTMLACVVLLLAGFAEPPLITERHVVAMSWKQERFLWVCLALVAIGFLRGDFTLGGVVSDAGSGKADVFGSLVSYILPVIAPLVAIGILQSSGRRRLRFIALGLLTLLAQLPGGRRNLITLLPVLCIAGALLSGRQWRLRRPMSKSKKVFLGLASVAVFVFASIFFYGLREAKWQMGEGTHSIGELVEMAAATTFRSPAEIVDELGENTPDRAAFEVRYLSWLGRGGNTPSPLMGQDFLLGLKMAVPDKIYSLVGANKDAARNIATEEGLANEHFGLPDSDDANSILTGGIIDFGLAGVLVYPLLVCFLTRLLLRLASGVLNIEGQIVLILSAMTAFMSVEVEVGDYVMEWRNMAILAVIWGLLARFPKLMGHGHELPGYRHFSRQTYNSTKSVFE